MKLFYDHILMKRNSFCLRRGMKLLKDQEEVKDAYSVEMIVIRLLKVRYEYVEDV
jgi:hypothetical protein